MRSATIDRNTLETQISVTVNLDGTGERVFNTGLPFLEHMLHQVARHGLIDLTINATGDLEIDAHHTVEDIGITLGQAIKDAVGDKAGIRRYGHAILRCLFLENGYPCFKIRWPDICQQPPFKSGHQSFFQAG